MAQNAAITRPNHGLWYLPCLVVLVGVETRRSLGQLPCLRIWWAHHSGADAVLVMTVCKEQANTLRPFVASPDRVAFLKYPLEGLYWFPHQDALMEAYHHSASFPSGHALFSTALGMYLLMHLASRGVRGTLAFFMVVIPLARLYLGVHYPSE